MDAVCPGAASPEERRSDLVDELREAGVGGRLAYTAGDCSFRIRTLPDFRPARSPLRLEGAACPFGTPSVADAPADDVALTQADLDRAAARHPAMPDDGRLVRSIVATDAARLAGGRAAVLIEMRLVRPEPLEIVAIFDNGPRIVATFVSFEPIERIEASPSGRYLAVEPGRILRADGTSMALPRGLEEAGPLAFSPDERWLAVGTRASVFLVPLAGRPIADVIRLPLTARDLAWR